jgi:hypothetical protein
VTDRADLLVASLGEGRYDGDLWLSVLESTAQPAMA